MFLNCVLLIIAVEVHDHDVSSLAAEAAYSITVTPTQRRTISSEVSPEVENGVEESSTTYEFCIGRQSETQSCKMIMNCS